MDINMEIRNNISKQIDIGEQLIALSEELEKDKDNQDLLHKMQSLTEEKDQLHFKSKELEKKLLK